MEGKVVKNLLSIIIPDRQGQPYLQKTIDGLLSNAEEEIEIIVVCDGTWPNPALTDDPRVKIIHHGTHFENLGMRTSINRGIAVSRGEYIMKIDEHCMVDRGFDLKLKLNCEDDWVVIPRRYRLDADEWRLEEYQILSNGDIIPDAINYKHIRPPVDYMAIDYPYQRPGDKTCGLHGAEWKRPDREELLIDDTPSMQGSCYFMKRSYWDKMFPNGLNPEFYGEFTQEAQEISLTAWLSGGRVVVNKKTWYAHMHKGKRGKGYGFSNEQYKKHMEGTERGRVYCIDYWLNTKDFEHDWKWFISGLFPDMPGWENWQERIIKDAEFDYSRRKLV